MSTNSGWWKALGGLPVALPSVGMTCRFLVDSHAFPTAKLLSYPLRREATSFRVVFPVERVKRGTVRPGGLCGGLRVNAG